MNQRLSLLLFAIAGLGYFSLVSYFQLNLLWQGEMILIPVQILAVVYFIRQRQQKAENINKN